MPGHGQNLYNGCARMTPHKAVVSHRTTVACIAVSSGSPAHFQCIAVSGLSHVLHRSLKSYYPTNVQTIAWTISSTSALTMSHRFTGLGMFSYYSPGCCPQPPGRVVSRSTEIVIATHLPRIDHRTHVTR